MLRVNVAVTLRAAVMLTVHVPVPVQAPLQRVKVEPLLTAGVRVTDVPDAYVALQVLPQLIPLGEDVTVPLPVPAFATVSAYVLSANVAVRLALALEVPPARLLRRAKLEIPGPGRPRR